MKSNVSVSKAAASAQNVQSKTFDFRPDGKKKSMTNLINKVGKLVNMKQNNMIMNVFEPDSSSEEQNNKSDNSDDSLME